MFSPVQPKPLKTWAALIVAFGLMSGLDSKACGMDAAGAGAEEHGDTGTGDHREVSIGALENADSTRRVAGLCGAAQCLANTPAFPSLPITRTSWGCFGRFHARRTSLACRGQADRLGLFLQQALDVGCRDMAFDDVVADPGRVAGGVAFRHAQFGARCRYILDVDRFDAEAVVDHVLRPRRAAAAVGTLVKPDLRHIAAPAVRVVARRKGLSRISCQCFPS